MIDIREGLSWRLKWKVEIKSSFGLYEDHIYMIDIREVLSHRLKWKFEMKSSFGLYEDYI